MKKKKVLLVFIVLLLIILIACAGVYAYMTLDLFRSPKQLFGKYLNNEIEQAKNMNLGALQTVTENLKNSVSETNYEVKLTSEYSEEDTDINLSVKSDPINSVTTLDLDVTSGETQTGDYSIYADKDKIGVRVPELNEKYFSIEMNTILNKFTEYLQTSGMTEKTIELSTEKLEEYENEVKELYNKYLEEIKSKFTDDKFSSENNVTVTVNGEQVTANRYSVSMQFSEINEIVSNVLTEISDESILQDFLTEDQIADLKENIEYTYSLELSGEENKTLKVCIYEKDGATIKIEAQIDDVVVGEFFITNESDTTTNVTFNTITAKEEDGEVGKTESIVYSVNVQDANTTVVTTTNTTTYVKEDVEALKEYYGISESDDESSNDEITDDEEDTEDIIGDTTDELEESEDSDMVSFSDIDTSSYSYSYYTEEDIDEMYQDTTTTQTVTTTLNGNTATSKIKLDSESSNLSYYDISKMQLTYKFGDQVTLDSLDEAIALEDYLDDETKMTELVSECTQNLQENPNTIIGGILSSFLDLDLNYSTLENETNLTGEEDDDNDTASQNNTSTDETDETKEKIQTLIKESLDSCLDVYKTDLEEDPNTNVGDYLTVEKISEMIVSSHMSDIELIDGSTLKCNYDDEIYYVILVINADTLVVDEATAYTEAEYENR